MKLTRALFFYSHLQEEHNEYCRRTTLPREERPEMYAHLDSGELHEFSESHSEITDPVKIKQLIKYHKDKWKDSKFLGAGVYVTINHVVEQLDKDLQKLERNFD